MLDVLVFYVPIDDTKSVLRDLFETGAGVVGEYRECAFVSPGMGQFRPVDSANPTIGSVGALEQVPENRVEISFPREIQKHVLETLYASHPYEEPTYHVIRNAAHDHD